MLTEAVNIQNLLCLTQETMAIVLNVVVIPTELLQVGYFWGGGRGGGGGGLLTFDLGEQGRYSIFTLLFPIKTCM